MRILLLLHPGVEELEAVGPTDIMRRAGLEVTLASTSDNLLVKGRNQIILSADALLEDIEAEEFEEDTKHDDKFAIGAKTGGGGV